jgi:hypothetical protein
MIPQPYKPLPYTISPARGQALLSFEGRRMPEHLPLFEVTKVEEVRATQIATAPAAAPKASASSTLIAISPWIRPTSTNACARAAKRNSKWSW